MPNYTETKTRLIINKLSREKYDYLVSNDLISENELYLVKDTNLDAVSARLINVGNPVSATDGANKQYIDGLIDGLDDIFYKLPSGGIPLTDIASGVIPDKTSNLVNDGEDGTSPFVTKAQAEAGWWSEWTVVRNGVNVTSQVAQFDGFYDSAFNPPEWTWLVWKSEIADDHGDEYVESVPGSENDAVVSWTSSTGASYVATRHRVCAPVPTNPEDIGAADATSVSARFDTVESLIDELSGSRTAVYIRVYDD